MRLGGLSQYHITTPSGTRIWHAESPEHAVEQHSSAFEGDPDEQILDIQRGGPSSHDDTPSADMKRTRPGPKNRKAAIGDTHHLASDTAEVFIAREIPVRPGVVMANRKMAGFNDTHAIITEHDTAQNAFLDSGHPADKEYLDQVRGELMERAKAGDPDAIEWSKGRSNFDPDKEQDPFDPRLIGAARKSHRELLAEIERLADWTKYDSPDPSRDPKAKPPSTAIPKQPKDWTNREFTGPDKGQWREPDPTELPRKTRKKK